MTEGTIVKWLKKEGDKIRAGDVLCEVQTDKAIVGLELEEEGILAKIILPDDSKDIKIGTLIAVMVEDGQDWKDVVIPVSDIESQTIKSESIETKIIEKSKESKHNLMGPSARNLLHQFGIDSNAVKSSGPHNTLLKEDVLQYIKDKQLKPIEISSVPTDKKTDISSAAKKVSTPSKYIDIELTNMRKTIAKRLTQSKSTIPHSYMTVDCLMKPVIKTRQKLKLSGINVSVNDFIIKSAGISLKKVPQINSSWNESTSSVEIASTVDISIAVATPNGLITPIIKNANQLNLETISKTAKELAEKARDGKLQPNEFMGGSFSISNLGMFGITEFSAVINPPQSAILAIGTSRLILDDNNETQHVMSVTLSYDSRVIEEDTAAKFLETFKTVIEDPIALQSSDGTDNRRLNALIS
jgi:pyruvate dehydrogenase complex dihydrolipoamide acetyltransferase long form